MRPFVRALLASVATPGEGQGLVEYGLVIVVVSLAAIAALVLVGGSVGGLFSAIIAALTAHT
jgi:Flp pilus assembly pilin Flp